MLSAMRRISFFFFQAEDGIRDIGVTGVQTCALPILQHRGPDALNVGVRLAVDQAREPVEAVAAHAHRVLRRRLVEPHADRQVERMQARSEERREGKSVDLGGRRIIKKKIYTMW